MWQRISCPTALSGRVQRFLGRLFLEPLMTSIAPLVPSAQRANTHGDICPARMPTGSLQSTSSLIAGDSWDESIFLLGVVGR